MAVLSAGAGVRHSEMAASTGPAQVRPGVAHSRPVRLLRPPTRADPPPRRFRVPSAEPTEGVVPVAGAGSGLEVGVAGASYGVARLGTNETLTLPAAPRLHVYVAPGALLRSSMAAPLEAGDAFCFVDEPDHEVTAGVPTELLVWTFGSGLSAGS